MKKPHITYRPIIEKWAVAWPNGYISFQDTLQKCIDLIKGYQMHNALKNWEK